VIEESITRDHFGHGKPNHNRAEVMIDWFQAKTQANAADSG